MFVTSAVQLRATAELPLRARVCVQLKPLRG